VNAPVIETERLTLRGHTAADLDDSLALWSDPQVVRFISGKASSREEVWARLLRYVGHWTLSRFGFWQVRERATGRFVGEAGLADIQRDMVVSFGGAPEAGWVLAPWSHGKGYATEAMRAVLAWADAAPHVGSRTACIISPDNAPSIRVASKCGYREVTRTAYKGSDVIVFERTGAP
jgi:RimJ/RimL family protein N-acetyltransferase